MHVWATSIDFSRRKCVFRATKKKSWLFVGVHAAARRPLPALRESHDPIGAVTPLGETMGSPYGAIPRQDEVRERPPAPRLSRETPTRARIAVVLHGFSDFFGAEPSSIDA